MNETSSDMIVPLNSPSRPVLSSDEWKARYPRLPRRKNKDVSSINWNQLCPSNQLSDTFSVKKSILGFVPILSWLPRYRWKEDTANDLVAGLTVAVMHIPQAMAYAILAGKIGSFL